MSRVAAAPSAEPIAARPQPEFRCSWKTGSNHTWVYAKGHLGFAATFQLEAVLREARCDSRLVVLDLRGVTFIEHGGLDVILDSAAEAEWAGARLLVVRGTREVDRMLTLWGARSRLEIVDLGPDPDRPPSTGEIKCWTSSPDGNQNLDGRSPAGRPGSRGGGYFSRRCE